MLFAAGYYIAYLHSLAVELSCALINTEILVVVLCLVPSVHTWLFKCNFSPCLQLLNSCQQGVWNYGKLLFSPPTTGVFVSTPHTQVLYAHTESPWWLRNVNAGRTAFIASKCCYKKNLKPWSRREHTWRISKYKLQHFWKYKKILEYKVWSVWWIPW